MANVSQLCRDRKVALQTVIRGRLRSLGETVRRHMYFKDITHRIIDGGKRKNVEPQGMVWIPGMDSNRP